MPGLNQIIESEWENGAEIALELNLATECMWSGELRYTPQPNNPNGPDRSYVFFAVGGWTHDEIINRLLEDFLAWKQT